MAEEVQDNPKQKLWSALNSAGYYTKSYEDFDKQFSTPENIGKLHSALNSSGYYTKSVDDFNGQFFNSQKKTEVGYEPSFQKAEKARQETPTQFPYKTTEQQYQEKPITPKQPDYAKVRENQTPSYSNAVGKLAYNTATTLEDFLRGGAQWTRDNIISRGFNIEPLYEKGGTKTQYASQIENDPSSWYKDPLGKLSLELNKDRDIDKSSPESYQLPNSFGGRIVNTAAAIAPDIILAGLTGGESAVASEGGSVIGSVAKKLLLNPFSKYLMAKEGLTNYAEAKRNGDTTLEANIEGAKGVIHGGIEGAKIAVLGEIAGGVSKAGEKALVSSGLVDQVGNVSKTALKVAANFAVFGASDPQHFLESGTVGAAFGIHEGINELAHEIGTNKEVQKKVIEQNQLNATNNLFSASPESVDYLQKQKATPEELNTKALELGKQAIEETDHAKKADLMNAALTFRKAADVKTGVKDIVKDRQSWIDSIQNNDQLTDEQKADRINKVEQIHKAYHPDERIKTGLGLRIQQADADINQLNDVVKNSNDPVAKAEAEVKLEDLTTKREELNNQLKEKIKQQSTKQQEDEKNVNETVRENVNGQEVGQVTQGGQQEREINGQENVSQAQQGEGNIVNESKLENNAVQEQKTNGEVLLNGQSKLGLQEMGERDTFNQKPTKEGEQEVNQEINKEEVNRITKERLNEIRDEYGLSQKEKIPTKTIELENEASRLIREGYDVPNRINELNNGAKPNAIDSHILGRYMNSLTEANNENPTSENLARLQDVHSTIDNMTSAFGLNLYSVRSVKYGTKDDLSNFLSGETSAFGVKTLPQDIINDLSAQYKHDQEVQRKLQEIINNQNELLNNKKAEEEFKKAKKSAPKIKKTAEDYAKERVEILQSIKDKFNKESKKTTGTIVPYANHLIAITPDVGRLVKSYAEEGISNLGEVVKNIHNDLKDSIEGLTEKDVRDIIAGEYKEKKKSKNEIAAQIRDLKKQAELEVKLEKLQKGEKLAKNLGEKVQKSKAIEDLEKQIKTIQDRNKDLEPPKTEQETEANRLKNRKAHLTRQIAKLKEELRSGNYQTEVKVPKPVKLDKEAQALEDEHIAFLKETVRRRDQARYEQKSSWEKRWDKFQEALGIRRLIQVSVDASMPFRQAASVTLNPRQIKVTAKSFGHMFKTIFSEKNYDRIMYQMESSPRYNEMVKDGVTFNQLEAAENKNRNEDFRTSFAYKIPYIGAPLKASERAANSYINTARFELMNKMYRNLEKQGITRESDPESYKEAAKWVNNVTGRGNLLSWLEESPKAQKVLGHTFYGGRLMASRFNLLNPVYYAKMPKEIRVEAMKDMASFTSTIMVTALAASAAGASVSLNPNESDFLKIRFGDTVYDLSGGMVQYIRTFLRLANAASNTVNPNVSKKDTKNYGKFALKSTSDFFRYKLAPNTSYALTAVVGTDPLGRDFDPYEALKIYPMYIDDMNTALKDDGGVTSIGTILVPNLLGLGVQQYKAKPKKEIAKEEHL